MPRLPLHGNWPCQTPVREDTPLAPRLVAALYVLMRDHIQPGDMEQVLIDVVGVKAVDYTNPHLEGLARAHAAYLARGVAPGKVT